MPNVTFAVSEVLHKEMRRHRQIRWAEIARNAFERELERLHVYDRLLAGSGLTERDAISLGRSIRRKASRRPR